MPSFVRRFEPGGVFFFTVVTHERRPLLTTPLALGCLRQGWLATREAQPFELVAHCLLPDHIHMVWSLPSDDSDYSTRWRRFKAVFTKAYLKAGGEDGIRSASRQRAGEAAIWQRRFWEHAVRDEKDLAAIIDYVHYNPVRHGYVELPEQWPYSSFRRYCREGLYDVGWGKTEPSKIAGVADAGEP